MNKGGIAREEWREEIRPALAGREVDERTRDRMEDFLFAAFDRDPGQDEPGIIQSEVPEILARLRQRAAALYIPKSKIDILEAELQKSKYWR